MPDTNAPPRREDDEDDAPSAEARMRLALGQLGTKAPSGRGGPGSPAPAIQSGPRRRTRFARDGEVPVERVPSPARVSGDAGHELAEERAARQRAEQALADAQGTISRLQTARTRAEQAAQAAHAAVEEREATLAALRADLVRAGQREAVLTKAARAEAERTQAEAKLRQAPGRGTEPVRWWLDYLNTPRP